MFRNHFLLLLGLSFAIPRQAHAEADQQLFQAVIDANKLLVERITKRFEIVYSSDIEEPDIKLRSKSEMKWSQRGGEIRSTTTVTRKPFEGAPSDHPVGYLKTEYLCKGGRHVTLTRAARGTQDPESNQQKDAIIDKLPPRSEPIGYPLQALGLMYDPATQTWVYDLLGKTGSLKTCKMMSDAGKNLVFVEKQCDRLFVQVWFDMDRDFYPVRRIEYYKSDSPNEATLRFETTVLELFPPSARNYPTLASSVRRRVIQKNGTVSFDGTFKVKSISFDSLNNDRFADLTIPANFLVADKLADQLYTSGADGRPATGKRVQSLSELQTRDRSPKPLAPPDRPVQPFPYRWVGLGAGLVLLGFVYYLKRRPSIPRT